MWVLKCDRALSEQAQRNIRDAWRAAKEDVHLLVLPPGFQLFHLPQTCAHLCSACGLCLACHGEEPCAGSEDRQHKVVAEVLT